MKQILFKCLILCKTVMVLSSCSMLSLEGETSRHNKTVISVSVPADPIPAAVKLLSDIPLAALPPEQQPRKLPRRVDQNLLPQETFPSEEPLRSILPEPSRSPAVNALAGFGNSSHGLSSDVAVVEYDEALLTEDTTWRDIIIIKGSVVVAPQATLRIEAGTVVRFAGVGADRNDAARLVVQGRIQAIGSAERPIIMTSDRPKPARGDWNGVSLLATEKRNILEQCRIEYAASGIQALFSTISLKDITIAHSKTGILSRDSVVQMTGGSVTDSGTGIEIHDSEFELRDASITANQSGIIMDRSAVVINSIKISDNKLVGVMSQDCRIKMTSGEVIGNGDGVRLKGGEGKILSTRFSGNRLTALSLAGTRIKVQRCSFVDNHQNALRLEDGRPLIWGNDFSGNRGFNLYNAGREDIVALQNWWGSSERSTIVQKIYDAARDPGSGAVQLFPWMIEKPQ